MCPLRLFGARVLRTRSASMRGRFSDYAQAALLINLVKRRVPSPSDPSIDRPAPLFAPDTLGPRVVTPRAWAGISKTLPASGATPTDPKPRDAAPGGCAKVKGDHRPVSGEEPSAPLQRRMRHRVYGLPRSAEVKDTGLVETDVRLREGDGYAARWCVSSWGRVKRPQGRCAGRAQAHLSVVVLEERLRALTPVPLGEQRLVETLREFESGQIGA